MNKQNSATLCFIFSFFFVVVFISFRLLFSSYFEADAWFHFAHFFSLIHTVDGFFNQLVQASIDDKALSQGQHLNPLAMEMFFLNTRFFGLNFIPYAGLSLFFHALNSFLVFYFFRAILHKKTLKNTFLAILGGVFFALNAVPMQAVTWAEFYGQNVVSTTFLLLCLISFYEAMQTKKNLFLYVSSLFLIIDLLTKEIAFILLPVIPLIILMNKKSFSWRLLLKIFGAPLLIYLPYRLYPFLFHSTTTTSSLIQQSGGLGHLLFYRAITYPLKMISEVFFSRIAIQNSISFITPFIYPQYGEEGEARMLNRLHFIYGPGNDVFVYLISFILIIIFFFMIRDYRRKKMKHELDTLIVGISIMVLTSWTLLFIVFSIPTWGFDSFFESRHYYPASVGAALIFPLVLLYVGQALSRRVALLKLYLPVSLFVACLFLIWFFQNMYVFNLMLHSGADLAEPRKRILLSLQRELPTFPSKVIFYSETDKQLDLLGAPQPVLPFASGFAQILTVVYADKNTLPQDFYQEIPFIETGEGYKQSGNRGFGYFRSKKALSEEIVRKSVMPSDIVSFYYDPTTLQVEDTTQSVRKQMQRFLIQRKEIADWKNFNDASLSMNFFYPAETEIVTKKNIDDSKVVKDLQLYNPSFTADLTFMKITPTITLQEIKTYFKQSDGSPLTDANTEMKRLFLDDFHSQEAVVSTQATNPIYLIKINDTLIYCTIQSGTPDAIPMIEKMLGSLEVKL